MIACRGRTAEIVAGFASKAATPRDRNKNRYLLERRESVLDFDAGFFCQAANQAGGLLHDGEVQEEERRRRSLHSGFFSHSSRH